MNCMAVRWGDDIIVIDAGLMFPEAELLGVDIVVPDISYLIENRQQVRGIVLTHGHEDHIGALPWILSELNVPVGAPNSRWPTSKTSSTSTACSMTPICARSAPDERFKIGPFTVHPIQVTHSLVDCVALAIHTPLGVMIHTGDFKVDPTPTDNRLFDLHAFAEYGKEGVLALFQDSTNVERNGYTPSERAVRRKFDEVFRAHRAAAVHLLLLVVDPSHQARGGTGAGARPQDRLHRPLDEQLGRDRRGPRLHRNSRRTADPSRRDEEFRSGKSLRADQRHAGRADVGAVARRGRQSQARQDREGRHGGAFVAHHSRQRERRSIG